ncbi:MAG: DUF6328 family protein [Actinomycetes bacterium]
MSVDQGPARPETDIQRADRRYGDLLQELRVAQTGVQFLFAFLLTLAFTDRFESITDFQQSIYIGTLLVTVAAAALLIGPVPLHRMLFRRGLKPQLVIGTDRLARGGLALLVVAVNGAVLLILDVVIGGAVAYLLTAATTLWFVIFWYGVPLLVVRHHEPGPD